MTRPKVAACLIVKNEEKIIPRLANSLKGIIDYYVIVDTGSTDNTIETIKASFDVPGEIHERPWVNFGHNRSELMDIAHGKADWLLLVDADHEVVGEIDVDKLEEIGAQCFLIEHQEGTSYWNSRIVNGDVVWCYRYPTHEFLDIADGGYYQREPYHGLKVRHHADSGTRSEKFTRDRDMLEAFCEEHPDDQRASFYLARTYKDLGALDKALPWFEKRIELGGWPEEVYIAKLERAEVLERMGLNNLEALLDAWEYRPHRFEAANLAVRKLRENGLYRSAYAIANRVLEEDRSAERRDILFVNHASRYELMLENSVCMYYLNGPEASMKYAQFLSSFLDCPENVKEMATANIEKCRAALLNG